MERREIVIYEQHGGKTLLSINEVSRFVGIHPDLVFRLFQYGLVDPQVEKPELLFEEGVLSRIKKILRLKNDLGVNLNGCGLVLSLLERINELEDQVRHYKMQSHK